MVMTLSSSDVEDTFAIDADVLLMHGSAGQHGAASREFVW
jgi:hypothetical protein